MLIEQVTFRLAPAGDEHAVEGLAAAEARHFSPTFAVAVHVEAHERIELGQRRAIHVEAKALAWKAHVVRTSEADPRACGKLRQHDGRGPREARHEPRRHARLQARKRRGVRSTYGSPRYTNSIHVTPNSATVDVPATTRPGRVST